jgi:transposase
MRSIRPPPTHAIVLSVDEKSQIQALDRTQPGLPLKKGRAGTSGVHPLPQRRRGGGPASKAVHVILDNYAAHRHPKVRQWLDRHQRFTFHFSPTSCSWLNAVEGFFATLTKRRLKRGVFHSIFDLQASINRFLKEHNMQPKPFVWTADPDKIIAAVRRGHQMLDSIH